MHLMGLGTVGYKHHHGHETGSDWAAKYDLIKVGGQVKFKHVQIIMVSIIALCVDSLRRARWRADGAT